MPPTARLIYTLDRDRVYHFLTVVFVVFAIAMAWIAWGLTPEAMVQDFGSVGAGRGVQVLLIALALGPLGAWLWFLRRFVHRLSWLPTERQVEIELCGYGGRRVWRLNADQVLGAESHRGEASYVDGPTVRAPYRRVRLQGRPSLILDGQGTTHDARALREILRGQAPR